MFFIVKYFIINLRNKGENQTKLNHQLQLKELYDNLVAEKLMNRADISRMEEYYDSIASFYPEVMSNHSIIDLFNKNNIDIDNSSLFNILNYNNVEMNSEVMNNGEIRCRIMDNNTKFSYVVVEAKNKQSGEIPHQNSHEHFYVIEVCRVELGFAIAAELMENKKVKLVKYTPGQYWASVPGNVHNTSLIDGSHTTTLKTSSPIPDWYGTGNVINSELSYFVDSCTKTMDLDQMDYVINHHNGIVSDYIVSEFKFDQKWNDLMSKVDINPYELLITPENKEQFRQLLLTTKDNNLAAFYAHLTDKNIKEAVQIANTFGKNIDAAVDCVNKKGIYDVSVAKKFIKSIK